MAALENEKGQQAKKGDLESKQGAIMKQRFKLIPAVFLVLQRNGNQVLLARRFNTGYEDGNYSMPAGHLDGDEPLTTAMAREAAEEIGITVAPEDLQLVHTMHRRSEVAESTEDERVDFYFTVDTYQGEPGIQEPHKCDNLQWFDLENLPDNIVPYVKNALGCIREGVAFSEDGWHQQKL